MCVYKIVYVYFCVCVYIYKIDFNMGIFMLYVNSYYINEEIEFKII